tara:strand:+ start:43 stop:1170 length:1128 start_codon:yes stop_codon:yes gene_type:complete
MSNNYYSLGLMSGTSMDGVDASVIKSDGKAQYKAILDKYFEYPKYIYQNLTQLRDKIKTSKDLEKFSKEIKYVEKKVTLFHAKAVNEILIKTKVNIDFVGFHGQTIFHNGEEKISKQLGDGKLLSKLIKKKVIYDFRQKDLRNGGQGAPLASIFHQLIVKKKKINLPVCVLNLGGIANVTRIINYKPNSLLSYDVGPGNCLIDAWIRKKTKKRYDDKGLLAKKGKTNKIILSTMYYYFNFIKKKNNQYGKQKRSLDIKDFNLPADLKKLSLKDGAATLTEFTCMRLDLFIKNLNHNKEKIILCGGGRKNSFLVQKLKNKNINIKLIDSYGIDGDFIESQAFAYLAIRSYLKLPISFPKTTGCKKSSSGGVIVKNF